MTNFDFHHSFSNAFQGALERKQQQAQFDAELNFRREVEHSLAAVREMQVKGISEQILASQQGRRFGEAAHPLNMDFLGLRNASTRIQNKFDEEANPIRLTTMGHQGRMAGTQADVLAGQAPALINQPGVQNAYTSAQTRLAEQEHGWRPKLWQDQLHTGAAQRGLIGAQAENVRQTTSFHKAMQPHQIRHQELQNEMMGYQAGTARTSYESLQSGGAVQQHAARYLSTGDVGEIDQIIRDIQRSPMPSSSYEFFEQMGDVKGRLIQDITRERDPERKKALQQRLEVLDRFGTSDEALFGGLREFNQQFSYPSLGLTGPYNSIHMLPPQ